MLWLFFNLKIQGTYTTNHNIVGENIKRKIHSEIHCNDYKSTLLTDSLISTWKYYTIDARDKKRFEKSHEITYDELLALYRGKQVIEGFPNNHWSYSE